MPRRSILMAQRRAADGTNHLVQKRRIHFNQMPALGKAACVDVGDVFAKGVTHVVGFPSSSSARPFPAVAGSVRPFPAAARRRAVFPRWVVGRVRGGGAVCQPAFDLDRALPCVESLGELMTGEHAVKVRILGPSSIHPGEAGLVRLHLPVALPLVPGDRYVLRESGRNETVGGGEILDVAPVLPASRAKPDRSVARVWTLLVRHSSSAMPRS